jgi:hypothetical protein
MSAVLSLMLALGLAAGGIASAEKAPSALVNGGFERDADQDGLADGWQLQGVAGRVDQRPGDGRWALSLVGSSTSPDAQAVQRVAVPSPAPSVATVSCLLRSTRLQPAGEGQATAKLTITYLDAQGQPVRKPKTIATWSKEVGWRPWTGLIRIPAKSAELELALSLAGADGQVMFDDVRLFWHLPDDRDRDNWLVDGGFEYHSLWSPWAFDVGQKVHYPGRHGHGLLHLSTAQPGRVAASQQVVVDPDAAKGRATVTLALRPDGVVAAEAGGGVWLTIEWQDADGAPVGRPARWGPWTGRAERWTLIRQRTKVPADARQGVVTLALEAATGTALIDDVRLELAARDGRALLRPSASRTPVGEWAAYEPDEAFPGGALDASDLLDAPAGRHGALRAASEGFAFEDGTPARFFGVNLDGDVAFGTPEQAEALAERLARLGCNLVRLHHLDARHVQPNIFDPAYDDTQHLSAEQLDRLDYLLAQLKARGIYVYLDLLVSRHFKAGDGVPAYAQLPGGAKVAALFHPRLIELQRGYARALLDRENPYTGVRWADEPALALIAVINESSLARFPKRMAELPEPYREELRRQWIDWQAARGAAEPEAQADRALQPADPEAQAFYAELQLRYLLGMRAYLRSLGVRAPIAGSNLGSPDPSGLDLATQRRMDFLDGHAYWDPPRSGVGDLTKIHNRPFIVEPDAEHPLARLARLSAEDQPFVVSEWNIDWPNEHRAVGPLLMAAYARLQGWDGLLQFNFDAHTAPARIASNFDVSGKPELLWQLPIAARLFHRGDVAPARERLVYPMSPAPAIPPALGLVHAIRRADDAQAPPAADPGLSPWVSDTQELVWDAQRAVALIRAPSTQAALGRIGGQTIDLPDAQLHVATPFAVVALSSLDGAPLAASARILVVAVARSENRGTVYTATRTMLRDSGQAPVLVEPVEGWIDLPLGERPAPSAYALDGQGRRTAELPVERDGPVARIPLQQAHFYEVVFTNP